MAPPAELAKAAAVTCGSPLGSPKYEDEWSFVAVCCDDGCTEKALALWATLSANTALLKIFMVILLC
jgi:hypothetical protein